MIKTTLTSILTLIAISACANAVQIIYEAPRNATPQQMYWINQQNMQSEQQQIMREQLRIQEQMLDLQRQRVRGW